MEFSTDGFDLDAVPNVAIGTGVEDVVYEVGCSATLLGKANEEKDLESADDEASQVARSEQLKAQGNEAFKCRNYLEAYDMYSAAIDACPGMKGDEILALREKFGEEERARLDEEEEQRRRRFKGVKEATQDHDAGKLKPSVFQAPSHPHGVQLAIYHCNRAACKLHLESYEDAIIDSDIAILLRPDWSKAYVRRSLANEKLTHIDLALEDATKALELDPSNRMIKITVQRLQKIEDERLEKLKEETIGKLKDLGNSILGNFGLSLDNFQAKQDPKTGSYSISFDQGKN